MQIARMRSLSIRGRRGVRMRVWRPAGQPVWRPALQARLETRFEFAEAALLLPLGSGFLVVVEQFLAGGGGLVAAEGLAAAACARGGEDVALGPEAFAGKEVVLHSGAGELLEPRVGEVVVERGALVLAGEIDPA